jgi:hypothetical protein
MSTDQNVPTPPEMNRKPACKEACAFLEGNQLSPSAHFRHQNFFEEPEIMLNSPATPRTVGIRSSFALKKVANCGKFAPFRASPAGPALYVLPEARAPLSLGRRVGVNHGFLTPVCGQGLCVLRDPARFYWPSVDREPRPRSHALRGNAQPRRSASRTAKKRRIPHCAMQGVGANAFPRGAWERVETPRRLTNAPGVG